MYQVRSDNIVKQLNHQESEISKLLDAVTGLMRDFADSQREITKLLRRGDLLHPGIEKLLLQRE